MNKLVSIIVPIYKVEKYLENCIDLLINQTYKNIEIILVNDGSPDNCPKICDEYAKKDSRIKVLHKENGGVSTARNAGLETAIGDYVYFMDPDDKVELNIIQKLVSIIDENNFAICKHCLDNNGKIIYKNNLKRKMFDKDEIYYCLNTKEYFSGYVWNKMYNLNLIKKYNLKFKTNLALLEDLVFNCEYLLLDEVIGASCVNDCLYTYYIRDNSAINNIDFSNKKIFDKKMSEFIAIEQMIDIYEKNSPKNLIYVKERYIKTTYKYVSLFKKTKTNLELLNNNILKAKKYYKEIKEKLPLKRKIKLLAYMKFPTLYTYLGEKRRVE